MLKIVDILCGKATITVEPSRLGEIASFIHRNKMSARIDPKGEITLGSFGYRELEKRYKDSFLFVERKFGIGAVTKFVKGNIALFISILACSLMFFASSGVVWDIRVSGNATLGENEIIEMLDGTGFTIGGRWRGYDIGEIETRILEKNDEIAWININRRGTVAYVEITESNYVEKVDKNENIIGNIVAECDCVIEEIVVKSGVARVKTGDIVRRGEVLISGIVETETGTVLVRAEGTVRGKCVENVVSESSSTEAKVISVDKALAGVQLNFFDFNINIFKNYGNFGELCDIIVEKQKFITPNGNKLPLGVTKEYEVTPVFGTVAYTDSELINVAYERHRDALMSLTERCDLIGIKTSADYTIDGYAVTSRVIYIKDVGEFSALEFGE